MRINTAPDAYTIRINAAIPVMFFTSVWPCSHQSLIYIFVKCLPI